MYLGENDCGVTLWCGYKLGVTIQTLLKAIFRQVRHTHPALRIKSMDKLHNRLTSDLGKKN